MTKPHIAEADRGWATRARSFVPVEVTSRLEVVTDDDGKELLDSKGDPMRVAVWSVRVKIGRTTTSFDLVRGKGSPDKRTPMMEDEVRDEIKRQIGHAAREAAVVMGCRRPSSSPSATHRSRRPRNACDWNGSSRSRAPRGDDRGRAQHCIKRTASTRSIRQCCHQLVDIAEQTGAISASRRSPSACDSRRGEIAPSAVRPHAPIPTLT
jgi:hypothetical protein